MIIHIHSIFYLLEHLNQIRNIADYWVTKTMLNIKNTVFHLHIKTLLWQG